MSGEFTIVFVCWRKKRRNFRLLFGQPARQVRLDWQRSLAAFEPGDLFAYERWEANKFGTQHWSISVLQAGDKGDRIVKLPGIKPGANLLAQRQGVDACKSFFAVFDKLRKAGVLDSLRPTEWQVIGHRIGAGTKPEYVLKDLRIGQ